MHPFDFIRTYTIPDAVADQALAFIDQESVAWGRHEYSRSTDYGVEDDIESNGDIEPEVFALEAGELSYSLVAFALEQYYDEFPEASTTAFCSARFNRYNKGQEMLLHWDSIRTLFDGASRGVPVCSVVGLLRAAEEGGEFVMSLPTGDQATFLTEPKTVVVFPSTYIYKHEVKPVIKGVRDSYVAWTHF